MSKFKISSSTSEEIPTSALPDIIFMLLFFFMVTTIVRPHEIMVEQHIPKATQLRKIEKKSLVAHFNIGAPKNVHQYGSEPKIQYNDVFIETRQIPQQVEEARARLSEPEKDKLTISLKIDEEVKMGIVSDVETQLKEVNALKVIYNTLKDS
ncbi:biopolymer transporter ExbD [Fulvivirgaceae bacterium BMA12]|uniref:Biopolymer transporter ExbD n=1 Tax=Agaribacillus aureus TaxID=3051825 RepID=A0ABT8L4D0_9BACT|nr:biopolymer transporter ExbD [Fulvivirgaceae bacterium BMA12]